MSEAPKSAYYIRFEISGLAPEEAGYLKSQIKNLQEVAYLGLSIDGRGLWGFIPVAYPEKYLQHFEALVKDFLAWGIVIDDQPENADSFRGCISDTEVYFNPDARIYTKLAESAPRVASSPNIRFSHNWVKGFGWENTVYVPEDFDVVEVLGFNEVDGYIFLGFWKNGKCMLKGYYES